jgi:3-oxoadipate enol-lactonase
VSGSLLARPDGAKIWWDVSGPEGAPAVVLVMGLGFPAAMWWRQVPALAKRFRVIVLDNRGAGNTGDVPGAPYTIATMSSDVVAVLDAAGAEKAHVVGISMGGMIAQEVALSHPDRVLSLVLLATHPGAQHATFLPEAAALLQSRVGQTLEQAAEVAIPFNYGPDTDRALIEQDWAVRFPLASSAQGYLAQLTGGFGWSSLERLSRLQAPLLVLHGDGDRLIPPSNGKLVATLVPHAEFVLIEGANHILTTDRADEVNALIENWVLTH